MEHTQAHPVATPEVQGFVRAPSLKYSNLSLGLPATSFSPIITYICVHIYKLHFILFAGRGEPSVPHHPHLPAPQPGRHFVLPSRRGRHVGAPPRSALPGAVPGCGRCRPRRRASAPLAPALALPPLLSLRRCCGSAPATAAVRGQREPAAGPAATPNRLTARPGLGGFATAGGEAPDAQPPPWEMRQATLWKCARTLMLMRLND